MPTWSMNQAARHGSSARSTGRHMAGSSAFPACRTRTAGSGKRPPAGNRRSPLDGSTSPGELLVHQAGQAVQLTVKTPGKKESKRKSLSKPDPRRKNPVPGMGQANRNSSKHNPKGVLVTSTFRIWTRKASPNFTEDSFLRLTGRD